MDKKKMFKWIIGIVILALVIFLIFRITLTGEIKGEEIEVKDGDIATYYNFSGSVQDKGTSRQGQDKGTFRLSHLS